MTSSWFFLSTLSYCYFPSPLHPYLLLVKTPSQCCGKLLSATECLSLSLFLCPSAWKSLAPAGQIFLKFDGWVPPPKKKICQENSSFTKIWQGKQGKLYVKTDIHFWSYPAQFFIEWEMSQTEVVEKIKTHFMFNNLLFESRAIYGIMWKNIVGPDRPQMLWCALHAGNQRLETDTQNM